MRQIPPLPTPAQGAPRPRRSPRAGFALFLPAVLGGVLHAFDLCSLGPMLALPSQATRARLGSLPLETSGCKDHV